MVVNAKFKIPTLRELWRSIPNASREWKSKTPMQKWCYLYGIGRAAYSSVRVSLMNDINHVHWFSHFMFVSNATIMLLCMYTVVYYAYRGESQLSLPSTCMTFIFIGVCKKVYYIIWIHLPIRDISKNIYAQKKSLLAFTDDPKNSSKSAIQTAIPYRFWRTLHLLWQPR